jgi:hypothetical protein
MLNQVFVTNKNALPHEDRYNGEDYVFPPGEAVLVPAEAAAHMFGYGLADKTDVLTRLGWAMKYDKDQKKYVEDTEGVGKLARFVFEEAVIKPKSLAEVAAELA